MNILVFGDIIGQSGRQAVAAILPRLRSTHNVDVVIANAENLAHGRGVTRDTAQELFAAGVDVLTTGNHVLDVKKGAEFLSTEPRVIRPLNYPPGLPGAGSVLLERGIVTIAVANVLGRVFMREQFDDPFRALEAWLASLPRVQPLVTLVDAHAEATSEKRALGFAFDGKLTALWGTHTHIPTADEHLLPQGTAYLTDVGMTGSFHSILGFQTAPILERFRTQVNIPFEVVEDPPWEVNALLLDIDDATGRARGIRRLREIISA